MRLGALRLVVLSCSMASVVGKLRAAGRLVTAHRQREGGGFVVRRPLGGEVSLVDPFLMLDHLGPTTYGPGEAIGAPDHPHRGFETVTIMLEGSMQHRDSVGNTGNLGPGWVQWMTAGAGIVHSEMPADDIIRDGGTIEGFQLWVNLPAKDKMTAPRYQDTPAESIPSVSTEDGKTTVRVIAGRCLGQSAAIDTRTPIAVLDVRMEANSAEFAAEVPADFNGFAYVYRGEGVLGSNAKLVKEGQMVILQEGDAFPMRATDKSECRLLLIAGRPIGEPIARHGPFVMNTREEIMQAFQDYQAGRLGRIEGADVRRAQTEAARSHQQASGRWSKEEL